MAAMIPTVLVADGDRSCADAVAMLLNRHGVEASCTYDGREAIHLAQRLHPQNVVMDVEMPGASGLEVARELRTSFGKAIRLVAYTGAPLGSERRRLREAGFDEWVPKSAQPFDLLKALSPAVHETVLKSIRANVRQMRNQLTLAGSLADNMQSTQDQPTRARLRDFLATRVEAVVASMARLPLEAPDRSQLWSEIEAMRERLEQFVP